MVWENLFGCTMKGTPFMLGWKSGFLAQNTTIGQDVFVWGWPVKMYFVFMNGIH